MAQLQYQSADRRIRLAELLPHHYLRGIVREPTHANCAEAKRLAMRLAKFGWVCYFRAPLYIKCHAPPLSFSLKPMAQTYWGRLSVGSVEQ